MLGTNFEFVQILKLSNYVTSASSPPVEESAIQDVFNTAGQSGRLSGPPRPSQCRPFSDKKNE